ncbi:MAG: hypothetical protein ACP5NZ_02845 [Nanobdellota archaeon]
MPKKKRVVRRKSNTRAKVSVKSQPNSGKIFSKPKLGLVIKNLVIFILLFLISWILYAVVISKDSGFSVLFNFLWVVFAFIALAFFISLLVLLLLKWMKS